ncbi:MAG: thioredoxin [Clostridia bacterium]|nr:thioredoxin [Clostridia bacterium]
MAVLHVDKNEFEKIKGEGKVILLDFYADWCGPCKMIAPIIEEIASERNDIIVAKVNVDTATNLAIEFGISVIPTLVVIKNGEIVSKTTGYRTKAQILELLK